MTAPARARFFLDGEMVHEMGVPQFDALPASVAARGWQQAAAQALVPGSVVMPGMEMVVEGEGWRIPTAGRQAH